MAVQVYGMNHVVIEVDDAQKAVEFYGDVFNLEMLRGGEGAAWCKLGEHQFLAIFEVETLNPDRMSGQAVNPLMKIIYAQKTEQTVTLRENQTAKVTLILPPPQK